MKNATIAKVSASHGWTWKAPNTQSITSHVIELCVLRRYRSDELLLSIQFVFISKGGPDIGPSQLRSPQIAAAILCVQNGLRMIWLRCVPFYAPTSTMQNNQSLNETQFCFGFLLATTSRLIVAHARDKTRHKARDTRRSRLGCLQLSLSGSGDRFVRSASFKK